ncbi:pentapeptide repeat-containing protein [Terriglobus saanensis]|nr:pentapeptide repeat-containing protein [Terriglobus saanensis]
MPDKQSTPFVYEPIKRDATEQDLRDAQYSNLAMLTRKAEAEAANAEYQNEGQTKRRNFYERILTTTQGAVILGLVTLLFQIIQFGYTAAASRNATREKAWRDAVAALSFSGDGKSVGAALNMETFFASPDHSIDAKALAASVLPYIQNENAFDVIFYRLLDSTSKKDQSFDVYAVVHTISQAYLREAQQDGGPITEPLPSSSRIGPKPLSVTLLESGKKPDDSMVVRATHNEYLIDTYTHGLSDLWKKHIQPLGASKNYAVDMRSVILFYDDNGMVDFRDVTLPRAYFSNAYMYSVDFTNADLTDAHLENTNLGNADLTHATVNGAHVEGANLEHARGDSSSWAYVEWWRASRISPSLCAWLRNANSKAPSLPPGSPNPCTP